MTININSIGEQIGLGEGKYKINLIGGWGIELNEFSLAFKNIQTQELLIANRSFWPVQSYQENRRTRRIMIVNINQEGLYEVIFTNSDKLIVRWSPLRMHRLWADPVSNERLEIQIER